MIQTPHADRNKTIKIINSPSGWLARFENDAKIMELFGTDTIPTPFNERATPSLVKACIEDRNPGYNVIFA